MTMKQSGRIVIVGLLVILWAGLMLPPVQARQEDNELLLLAPVSGTLDAEQSQVTYSFAMKEAFVFSALSWTRGGDLISDITILDPSGQVLAEDAPAVDDEATRIIEAIIAPSDGTYTLTISQTGSTSGEYGLLLLPGYSGIDIWDDFESSDSSFAFSWEPSSSQSSESSIVNGAMQMHVIAADTLAYKSPLDDPLYSDLYLESDVTVEGSPGYAEYGFIVRLNADTGEFYAITFSTDNDWSVSYYNGEWTTIMPWTVSPAIDTTDTTPHIGVFVQGNTFRAYFNDRFVGEATDLDQFLSEGEIALAAATAIDQTEGLTVYHDNLVITQPTTTGGEPASGQQGGISGLSGILGTATVQAEGETGQPATVAPIPFGQKTPQGAASTATPLPPTKSPTATPLPPTKAPSATPQPTTPPDTSLSSWQGSASSIVTELQQNGLVPAGGSSVVNIPSSFGDTSSSGLNFYPLGQGRQFRNFVLGFTESVDIGTTDAGCGMHFRRSGNSFSTALIIADGSILFGQITDGDFHPATVFDFFPSINAGVDVDNRVVVVAIEDQMRAYINGELIGSGSFDALSGTIALEMYVPEDDAGNTQRTYCQLNDIWLWEF